MFYISLLIKRGSVKLTRFKISPQWKILWKTHPDGYTIVENLIEWASQANLLDDEIKNTQDKIKKIKERINEFIEKFDADLRGTVADLLEEWDQEGFFEEVINHTIFNELNEVVDNKVNKDMIYRKEVFKTLPFKFPDYNTIVNQENLRFLYPQAFDIDWQSELIFILYYPESEDSTVGTRWIVVYDLKTGGYITCFGVGEHGYEGVKVLYKGGERLLYAKTTGTKLGEFNITDLPPRRTKIEPVNEYDVGLHSQFNYNDGKWIIGQSLPGLGTLNRLTEFAIYDDSFRKIGTISLDVGDVGLFNSNYSNYVPKTQGVAYAKGAIYLPIGGIGRDYTIDPYGYQGLRVLNSKGDMIVEGLIDHRKMIDILRQHGFECERVENEGVHVAPNGDVYTLLVHKSYHTPNADSDGLIIFKEFSNSRDAIDFSSGAVQPLNIRSDKLSTLFPRNGDGLYNPLTGAKIDTLDKLLDFMIETDLPRTSFYTSIVQLKGLDGKDLPLSTHVIIYNVSNTVFRIVYIKNGVEVYNVYGESGSRVQEPYVLGTNKEHQLTLRAPMTNFWGGYPCKAVLRNRVVHLEGRVNNIPEGNNILITTLPDEFIPPVHAKFICSAADATAGDYGVIEVRYDGEVRLVYRTSNFTAIELTGISYLLRN